MSVQVPAVIAALHHLNPLNHNNPKVVEVQVLPKHHLGKPLQIQTVEEMASMEMEDKEATMRVTILQKMEEKEEIVGMGITVRMVIAREQLTKEERTMEGIMLLLELVL